MDSICTRVTPDRQYTFFHTDYKGESCTPALPARSLFNLTFWLHCFANLVTHAPILLATSTLKVTTRNKQTHVNISCCLLSRKKSFQKQIQVFLMSITSASGFFYFYVCFFGPSSHEPVCLDGSRVDRLKFSISSSRGSATLLVVAGFPTTTASDPNCPFHRLQGLTVFAVVSAPLLRFNLRLNFMWPITVTLQLYMALLLGEPTID